MESLRWKTLLKERMGKKIVSLLGSMIVAGVLCVLGDLAIAWQGVAVPCSVFLAVFILLAGIIFFIYRKKPRGAMKTAAALLGILLAVGAVLFAGWKSFSGNAVFQAVDDGKQSVYADRKVMLIVPHQDDEINVLGGVMEEYVRYGSQVYPVFVTNGDAEGLAEIRFREALDVCKYIGIPEENVIFLGYGDTLPDNGIHIYNAAEGQVATSSFGAVETYGTRAKGVWREGAAYTKDNLLEDLESVIVTIRPEIIFCSDYDAHIDHRAVTLAFEKVMGKILRQEESYRPVVMKGYAYSTAWYAQPDFYECNILSTQNVFGENYGQTPEVYRWEDRVRLPVGDYTLSRSLFSSEIFHTLSLHASQEAIFQGARVVNGDKVVWHRSTESLLYKAAVEVSSGDSQLLTDFMLLENHDLMDPQRLPEDGVWIPEDEQKTVAVSFPEKANVKQILLYDHPSKQDNVLNAQIVFSDGTVLMTGPLDPGGAATVIEAEKTGVDGFMVTLTETEGTCPGLTELEAFAAAPDHGFRFLKVMDAEDNFIYDYWLPSGSNADLHLYTCGLTTEQQENLQLSWDSDKCWAEMENGHLRVIVPEGKTMLLTVSVKDTDISDTVKISNPGKLPRLHCWLGQMVEEQVFQKYCNGNHRNSATYKLIATALALIR